MAQYRKPIPKTQREISEDLVTPFSIERGNPNARLNPNESETGINFNRSKKISYKDDTTKPFSIGIQDLDEAVFFYFENVNIVQILMKSNIYYFFLQVVFHYHYEIQYNDLYFHNNLMILNS